MRLRFSPVVRKFQFDGLKKMFLLESNCVKEKRERIIHCKELKLEI